MAQAIAVCQEEQLLRELNGTTERAVKGREQLVREVERELKTHAQIEEELFYPTFKSSMVLPTMKG